MGKTYRAEYTVKKGNNFRIAVAGNYLVARIAAAAPEGKMVRFTVRQVGGVAVPFTVDWLDSMVGPGLVPGEYNPGTNPLPGAPVLDMYRIMTQTSGAAGQSAHNLAHESRYELLQSTTGNLHDPCTHREWCQYHLGSKRINAEHGRLIVFS
jgi:hypothetical protein